MIILRNAVPVFGVIAALVGSSLAMRAAPSPQALSPQALPQGAPTQEAPSPYDAILNDARQAYDDTNYERARELLDSIITGFGSSPASPEQRKVLAAAYELRARTRFNLRNTETAQTDFRALLLLDPSYLLSVQVGPRVLALFEDVKKTTIGAISVEVMPLDATVMLDDARITAEVTSMNLVGGTHTISASRTGYAPGTQTFTVIPGTAPQRILLSLDRVSSTVALTTSPANIEVLVDGVARGVTELDPEGKAEGGGLVSKRFLLTDLPNGRHRIEFRRECFIGAEQEFDVQRPSDYKLEPVKLAPAVATVSIDSNVPGSSVFVDDTPRGATPVVLDDICQGPHTIEVRTPYGRHLRRMELKPGQRETFNARVRPAFAIISDSGAAGDVRGGRDLRLAAEQAFQETGAITLFAPPDKRAAELMAADQLPIDWLAFDVLRRPLGKAATIGEPARAEIGARMARTLSAQGLAAIVRDPAGNQSDMLLTLLAPGSAEPDVIRWRLDDPQSVREAIRQLDQAPALYRASIGVIPIDIQDLDGAVVASVTPGSSGEAAGLRPGETIVSAGGSPVRGVVQLVTSVSAKQTGQTIELEVHDAAGTPRKVAVVVQAVPNVVSINDRALLSNKLAVEYGYRAAGLTDPLEEVAVRLNLAALSLRMRSRSAATRDLERVIKVISEGRLPPSLTDPLTGTAQYLLGLAAEGNGDNAAAERAWRTATQSTGNMLSDGGEPIKDLADQRLNQLLATRTGGRP